MHFKDIVNRDVVNLTNCEHEPIHVPGSIQPHGWLLGLSTSSLVMEYCSANSGEFISLGYESLLGRSFESVFGSSAANSVRAYLSTAGNGVAAPLSLELAGRSFTCTVQVLGRMFLLEAELSGEELIGVGDIYMQTRQFTSYMQNATTLQSLCQAVAEETRKITGYDRVMIYRFDEHYNGEIIAESCLEELEPFLNLHYPHTDIPAQARELYMRNLLRLIVDVNYQPVPIYTLDDSTDRQLDLSLSVLRSVSPIHIQYLQNMGVGATLTISLMHEQRLWGLIACHHYSPKHISMHTRIAAQLQGHFLTSQIQMRQDAEEYAVARNVNASLDLLLEHVFSSESLSLDALIQRKELLDISNATGVIIMVDGVIYKNGKVPQDDELRKLVSWLYTFTPHSVFSTEKVVSVYADGIKCTDASGIIFHPLGSGPESCIIWCRRETLQEVHWAGDPEKAIVKDEKGLSPRKSFELWKEVKKCESNKWQRPELNAASTFSNALQKHVYMLFLSKEELKQRRLSERLIEANAELENINWIGSHDLKEPLRKIQMFASRILEEEEAAMPARIMDSVKRMNESANRMQVLIKDILSYSRLSHLEDRLTDVDLALLLAKVKADLVDEINEKNAVIEYGNLPVIKGIDFLLQQLFVNLLRNALKFSRPEVLPHVVVSSSQTTSAPEGIMADGKYYMIKVQDNGIGFDNEYQETIFKVFSRLHNTERYAGTGVGLALCRKIMKKHNGYITAEGMPGVGATFNLYFPVQGS